MHAKTHVQIPLNEATKYSATTTRLKLEAPERILRLLQLLLANECTRREIFEHLALYYKIDRVAAHQPV